MRGLTGRRSLNSLKYYGSVFAKLREMKVDSDARAVLEGLHERGMLEGSSEKQGRVYDMDACLYRRLGEILGYIRSRGFDRIEQQQIILRGVKAEGKITR